MPLNSEAHENWILYETRLIKMKWKLWNHSGLDNASGTKRYQKGGYMKQMIESAKHRICSHTPC